MNGIAGSAEIDRITDVETLRTIAKTTIEKYQEKIIDFEQSKERIRELEIELLKNREELALHLHKIFGRMSERMAKGELHGQVSLFDEAEHTAGTQAAIPIEEDIPIEAHTRRRGKRAPLSPDLPRVEDIIDILEEEKISGCGNSLVKIGEDVSEKMEIIPAQFRVRRTIRPRYACKSCGGTENEPESAVVTAPVPQAMLPKSNASSSLLATVITWKFQDGLPLNRQERVFSRHGVDLGRATLSRWVLEVGDRCSPIIERLERYLLSGPMIGMDETPVQVHKEMNRKDTTTSYMWVARGGPPGKPVIRFIYKPTRGADVPLALLEGYRGVLQTDGYSAYDAAVKALNAKEVAVHHVGCMVHARREFVEADTAGAGENGTARTAIAYFKKLYAVERECRDQGLVDEAKTAYRKEKAVPILDSFNAWLMERKLAVPPHTLAGKAIIYTLNQWEKLIRYVEHPFTPIDNNLVENSIRPFVVGRKAWLFSGSPSGATSSAALYTIIETAKASGHEPFYYLYYLFEKLPLAESIEDYDALLPFNVTREAVYSYAMTHWLGVVS